MAPRVPDQIVIVGAGPASVATARSYRHHGGAAVGVLTHERDADYERGREAIATGALPPR